MPGRGPAGGVAAAEDVAEEAAAEDVAEGRHDVVGVAEVVDARPFHPGVAVAVVPLALRLVGEDFIRLGRLLEAALGLLVPGVLVRVILQGELPIGLLDLVGRRVPLQAQDLVIVALRRHRHGISIGDGLRRLPPVHDITSAPARDTKAYERRHPSRPG